MSATATSAQQLLPADAWWEECKAAAAQRGCGEDYLLPVGEVQADEEEDQPTLDDFRACPVVICPAPVQKAFEGIVRDLWAAGCDEGDDPDGGFRLTSTSSSYGGQDVVGKHLRKVEALLRKADYPGAFTHLLATQVAAKRDDYWFMDTDAPEEVQKLVTKFDRLWGKVLARSDGELGGVTAADREAVEVARQELREQVEQCCLME